MAFAAQSMPVFGYGCAVFMQSDIVNFQRQGWQAEEILAGLAAVLPKNVFLYVASIPNLANLGSRFVLQGGTQNNLAVVKAEVDFINSSFRVGRATPEIIVHEHCGESGAIGAAIEAVRLCQERPSDTTFIGLDAVRNISYRTTRNEDTRCYFCKNNCLRTFIDVSTTTVAGDGAAAPTELIAIGEPALKPVPAPAASCSSGCGTSHHDDLHATKQPLTQIALAAGSTEFVKLPEPKFQDRKTKVPLFENEQRLIIATCEKGTVEDVEDMKGIKGNLEAARAANPNFVELASREVFRFRDVKSLADPVPSLNWWQKRNEVLQTAHRADAEPRPRSASACRACSTCTRTRRCSTATSRRSEFRRRTSSTPTTPRATCTARAPTAAPSTPASRPRSGCRTCTTC